MCDDGGKKLFLEFEEDMVNIVMSGIVPLENGSTLELWVRLF